ncbi:MAG: DUF393 domain-containing protein [Anaerolineales bacterium]|nr:DUF393 domain-containing protein [Anaerolineales bacterium]
METWLPGRVDVRPWQMIPEQLATLGLTAEDGMTQVWFWENGRLFGGAEAVNRLLRHLWWLRPFTYLYYLPGIKQLQNWGYRWVADNRYRLPGSTPACAIPPKTANQYGVLPLSSEKPADEVAEENGR